MRARTLLRELSELDERREVYAGVGCHRHPVLGFLPGPRELTEEQWEAIFEPWCRGPGPDGGVPPLGRLG